MADIEVTDLTRTFRGRTDVHALRGVSFGVGEGDMLVLLGPSGCGKTTTLRCLAGLEVPDGGRIRFGDVAVCDVDAGIRVPAHRRSVGLVFQSFALWPHMSAHRNIEFPLRARRVPRHDRLRAVGEVAGMVDLTEELLRKRPGQLSGGQQQRVALARALVAQADLVLFDEPLSNLDAQLREQLRSELHALHRRLGFTGVYVTHDLTEALAIGTKVAVMHDGRIAQIGAPSEVFEHPSDPTTARVLGFRRFLRLSRDGTNVTAEEGTVSGAVPCVATRLDVYVRPERLRITPAHQRDAGVSLRLEGLTVIDVTYLGEKREIAVQHGDGIVRVLSDVRDERARWQPGEQVALSASIDDLRMFDEAARAIDHGSPAREAPPDEAGRVAP